MNQFKQLIGVNFKEFFREPGIIFWAVFFPILMAWGLGIAFKQKGDLTQKIALVAHNNDWNTNNENWNKLISNARKQSKNTPVISIGNEKLGVVHFQVSEVSWDEAIQMLKKGITEIILEVKNDSLMFHFDPHNPEAQLAYLQFQTVLNNSDPKLTSDNFLAMEQKGTRYIDFLVPGLLSMSVMMSCMWGISYGMIDKRSKKLLRRMVATPMSKPLFLAAQFIARLGLSFLEAFLLILFCYFYFDVTISGSILAFLIIFITGNIAFTGIAILTSSRTAETRVGNGLVNVVVMPMMILSGIFFSYHNFPDWAIKIIEKLPLTLMADYTRSVFIEGMGLSGVLFPATLLTLIGVILAGVGLKIYKWY